MVVTRRTPVVPPQPLARNHSFQGGQHPPPQAPLAKDTAGVPKNSASGVAAASLAGSSNGNKDQQSGPDNNSGKKSKKSRRHSKEKYRKTNFQAFLDFLTKLLLLAFIIYTFSVCPQDTHLQSPICRGLTEYKRIVLDPYIIPPFQAMLAHPSVAPHIERAKPYVNRAVKVTTPILLRAQQEWNLHVIPQWKKRVVPEWNKRIVPQWNKYVVSQWDKYVAPRIQLVQSTLEPYRLRATQEYGQRIVPHAQVATYNLQRWHRQARPYVLQAVVKTKDAYYAVKPYAVPLGRRLGHLLQQLALSLREQRQKFVDPHVAQIWEKVKELSRGRQVAREATPEPEPLSSDVLSTVLETLEHEIVLSSADSLTAAYHATSALEQVDVSPTLPSLSLVKTADVESHSTFAQPTFTLVPELESSTQLVGTPTVSESSLSAESVLVETLHKSDPLAPSASAFTGKPDATTPSGSVAATAVSSSRAPPAVDEPLKSSALVASSKITVPAASATSPPSGVRQNDEIDLDAFYAELGLDEPLGNPGSSEYNPGAPSPPEEPEEERAERLRLKAEETARKRADIEARQAKWEAELQAQMERSTSQLQSRLGNLRATAAAELTSSADVRTSIEELVNEAEKYLKGAEIYLKNLKGENRKSDEKLALWDRVAERVNDKFGERLSATEGVVNTWYRIVLDKELEEVATAVADVREVAEKGQLDLGLDYAWLEDVTYNDWQRYHALVGTSEQYAHEAASIQNGAHSRVVVTNPLSAIFRDLESEIEDVVIGFETRLRRIKRDGERAFNGNGNGAAQKEGEKGAGVEPEADAEPEVSILPVPREGGREEKQGFIPPVVIGRSREEVLEALGKVEAGGGGEQAVSGSHVDPEEAVSRLVQDVADGGAEIHHTEL